MPDPRDVGVVFGARARRAFAEIGPEGDSPDADAQLLGANLKDSHIAELLHRAMWLEEHHPETSLALGTFLAATGELEEAKVLLEAATTGLSDSPFARYMYVDCCRALGAAPDHDMFPFLPFGGELEDALLDEGVFTSSVASRVRWQLVFNGMKVGVSVASPLLTPPSERTGRSQVNRPISVMTSHTDIDLRAMVKSLDRRLDELHQEQRETRTDVAGVGQRLIRAIERDDVWLTIFAQALPESQRTIIEEELSSVVTSWHKLPPVPRRELIVARWLTTDSALYGEEVIAPVIRSLGLAIESLARKALGGLEQGAMLGDIVAHAEDIQFGSPEIRNSLGRLRELRNRAAHLPGGLGAAELDETWRLVLGTKGAPGLLVAFCPH